MLKSSTSNIPFHGSEQDFNFVLSYNIAREQLLGRLVVKMLRREEEDARFFRYKAIAAVTTGALMCTGAIFDHVLAMQVSGVCALALGGKVIYDYFSGKNKRENKQDARSLLELYQKQHIVECNRNARPPFQANHDRVGIDENSWKTASPPSYEQTMCGVPNPNGSSSCSSSLRRFPGPSTPELPPPEYQSLRRVSKKKKQTSQVGRFRKYFEIHHL